MRNSDAEELYDKYNKLRNATDCIVPLSREVFVEYGINTFHDLSRYLKRNGEYGGAIILPRSNVFILLPFHNDMLNKWLRFENPRVRERYKDIYELYKQQYPNVDTFKKDFFNVEEDILKRYWNMPEMDTRFLNAPIAGCWDKMELQATFAETLGYEVKRFCFHGGRIIRGHTFILYYDGTYWNTCLNTPFPIRNKRLDKLCQLIFNVLLHIPFLDNGEIRELIEFNSPHGGMSAQEYIKLIEDGKVIIKKENHRWRN